MGLEFEVMDSGVDDGALRPGPATSARHWVAALAYLKAAALARPFEGSFGGEGPVGGATVLGADTVCALDGALLGQPRDAEHAAAMIRSFEGREHEVLTGVALVSPDNRMLLTDVAVVRVGRIGPGAIGEYVSTGGWRGKAGGYNLSERLEAGWPIEVSGDPGTVMGLPVERLGPLLARFRRTGS